jgi:hypothetical protein
MFKKGDKVVYTKSKHSSSPGPRARDIHPAKRGEDYGYVVDKFWRVGAVRGDSLVLVTHRGKTHVVRASDPLLRKARKSETRKYDDHFPTDEVIDLAIKAYGHES